MAFFTKKQRKTLIPATFWALVGLFVLIISMMTFTMFRGYMRPIFIPILVIFSLLGLVLLILTLNKKKIPNKKFLILTGASSVGFFVFAILHNFFYALAEITSYIIILSSFFEVLHAIFFIIGVFVCPLGFLVGVVGSIVLFVKKRKKR